MSLDGIHFGKKGRAIPLAKLSCDGTQTRAALCEETINDYADLLRANPDAWPFDEPLVVFFDGKVNWVSSGHHRIEACRRAGRDSAMCVQERGSKTDAIWYGMEANARHGKRLTNADKRFNVNMALDICPTLSQREIARRTHTTQQFVSRVISERNAKSPPLGATTVVHPDGGYSENCDVFQPEEMDKISTMFPGSPEDHMAESAFVGGGKRSRGGSGSGAGSGMSRKPAGKREPSVAMKAVEESYSEKDRHGNDMPRRVAVIIEDGKAFEARRRELSALAKWLRDVATRPEGKWVGRALNDMEVAIKNIQHGIKFAAPYCVCPYCWAKGKKCEACGGDGWVTEDIWKQSPAGIAARSA